MTSVQGIVISPDRAGPIWALLAGILLAVSFGGCGVFGLVGLATAKGDAAVGNVVIIPLLIFAFIGVALSAYGIWWLLGQKPRYAVLICTAAGEQQACVSSSEEKVDAIIDALNKALIHRG